MPRTWIRARLGHFPRLLATEPLVAVAPLYPSTTTPKWSKKGTRGQRSAEITTPARSGTSNWWVEDSRASKSAAGTWNCEVPGLPPLQKHPTPKWSKKGTRLRNVAKPSTSADQARQDWWICDSHASDSASRLWDLESPARRLESPTYVSGITGDPRSKSRFPFLLLRLGIHPRIPRSDRPQ